MSSRKRPLGTASSFTLPLVYISLSLLGSTAVYAHGLDPGAALIRLAGDTIYVTATPEMRTFRAFDDNKNGLIDKKELTKHRAAMLVQFRQQLHMAPSAGRITARLLEDISRPHSHRRSPKHLRVTLRLTFSTAPDWVDMTWRLATSHPLAYQAQRMSPGALITQRPLGSVETGRFDRKTPKKRLFIRHTTKRKKGKE